ncbi:MAG TPA: N-acetylmuramoyl-L-alanine amidase [Xanthobacteraceae bacterium]|nr:N-acetylmuramoyl-L-alanine amidase [Xanthobacteraceae bacterium]
MHRMPVWREVARWRLGIAAVSVCAALLARPAAAADSGSAVAPPPVKAATCARAARFRVALDVGHTAGVPGALSARGATEYAFNLQLARTIEQELRASGFDSTVLMITAEAPPVGLFRRVARASRLRADLFLAIHHDAVPDRLAETWQFAGQTQHFSDRFPGHSLFVSTENANHAGSLAFARLLGNALEARGLHYTHHYTDKFMGSRQRVLLDPQAGVYRYNKLIVLKESHMPAALLEAGSIVNRDEELLLATRGHQGLMAGAVVEAVDAFCVAGEMKNAPALAAKKH